MKNPGNFGYYSSPLYHDLPNYPGPDASERGRVFLVAIQGEQAPPDDRGAFDRVHVMVIQPGEMADFSYPLSVLRALPEMPALTRRALPACNVPPARPRPVNGEILRNQEGQFYERRGQQLFPLRNLASGPCGEVIEFGPASFAVDSHTSGIVESGFTELIEGIYETGDKSQKSRPHLIRPSQRTGSNAGVCRKLFADPGQLRLVSFGDFRAQLAPQLRNPDRLRDAHRLPCYVQVFEISRPQRADILSSLVGDVGQANQLRLFDEAAANKLGLADLPQPRMRHLQREPGWLLPGDRVCRLQLVRDPTFETGSEESDAPLNAVKAQPAQPPGAESSECGLKKAIPERYLKPWEFQRTREEVLYDINMDERGWLRSAYSALRAWTKKKELRRWRSLLAGKAADDQLWTVRPPSWGLTHPPVREWARSTLALAGYDADAMVTEWEVFWRRKGL
jgi:hypothetical protein